MHRHIYFNADCGCDYAPFVPPEHAGLEEHVLGSFHGEFNVKICFVSNDYIIINVPRRLVFMVGSPNSLALETLSSWAYALT
jgi:hypothetical protein